MLILTISSALEPELVVCRWSELERNLEDATIIISTPFHPAYITRERIEKAKKLKLLLTAGIGSDHVDLRAAADHGLTVAECVGASRAARVVPVALPSCGVLCRQRCIAHAQARQRLHSRAMDLSAVYV